MKPMITLFLLFTLYSSYTFGQTRKASQLNTEYVLELMKTYHIEHIYIVGINKYFEYDKEWLDDVQTDGEYITFKNKKEEKVHSWNISNTTFVERYRDVIKVRLSVLIGE